MIDNSDFKLNCDHLLLYINSWVIPWVSEWAWVLTPEAILHRASLMGHYDPCELCGSCNCPSFSSQQAWSRHMIRCSESEFQHGGTAGPPLRLFCTSPSLYPFVPPSLSLLLLVGRLPPQLLASTRVSYVRPVYTSSSATLIIHLMPRQADTSASDTAIFVLIGRPGQRTLPHLAGNYQRAALWRYQTAESYYCTTSWRAGAKFET